MNIALHEDCHDVIICTIRPGAEMVAMPPVENTSENNAPCCVA